MNRIVEQSVLLLNSLGIALLVCSLILVPSGMIFADTGGTDIPLDGGCSGSICNNTQKPCLGQSSPYTGGNTTCDNSTPGHDCSACVCQTWPMYPTSCYCSLP